MMSLIDRYAIKVFVALFFVALSSSCKVFEDESCADDGIFVTFTINTSTSDTRTYGPSYSTEDYESTISNLKIYLVSQNGGGVIKMDGSTIGWNSATQKTDMIRLDADKAGTYRVYVVTNSDGEFEYDDSGIQNLLQTRVQMNSSDCQKIWRPDCFAMSNANDTFDEDFMENVTLVVGQHTQASPLNIKINLDRLACKVIPSLEENATYSLKGLAVYGSRSTYYLCGLNVTGVSLINCTNSFNLFQHWEKGSSWSSGGSPDGYPEMLLVSPSSSRSYSMNDGYYNRWQDYVNTDLTVNDAAAYSELGSSLYCLENNSPYYTLELAGEDYLDGHLPGTKMKGRTTGVVFRVQYLFKEGEYVTEDINHDGQEHSWGTDVITGKAENLLPDVPGTWSRTTETAPAPIIFYVYYGRYFADLQRLVASYPELGTDTTVSSLRAKGVSVYENAQAYYIYWIKDENYRDGGNAYYSVIRNTCYSLNVQNIAGLGEDIPGGHEYDANDPIDLGDVSIRTSLVITSWDSKDIKETL